MRFESERVVIIEEDDTYTGTRWKIQAEGYRSSTSALPGPYVRAVGYADTEAEAQQQVEHWLGHSVKVFRQE